MKKAFTMIELIFVIVILGIISAIAIPKLTASKNDAKIIKLKTDIITVFKDIAVHFIANGEFSNDDLGKITNVALKPPSIGNNAWIIFDNGKPCIGFAVWNGDLYNIFAYKNSTSFCKEVLQNQELKPLLTDNDGVYLLDAIKTTSGDWYRIAKPIEN